MVPKYKYTVRTYSYLTSPLHTKKLRPREVAKLSSSFFFLFNLAFPEGDFIFKVI